MENILENKKVRVINEKDGRFRIENIETKKHLCSYTLGFAIRIDFVNKASRLVDEDTNKDYAEFDDDMSLFEIINGQVKCVFWRRINISCYDLRVVYENEKFFLRF